MQRMDISLLNQTEILKIIQQRLKEGANSTSPTVYECEICKDDGVVPVIDDKGYERYTKCKCQIIKRYQQLFERSGISQAFANSSFDNFEKWNGAASMAYEIAFKYSENFNNIAESKSHSLALLGSVGAGKTHLGVAVLNQLMKRNIAVRYTPYREMATRLKQLVTDDEGYEKELKRYTKPDVLFIDDLFKCYTNAEIKYVYEVVNARYIARKPVIITSERYMIDMLDIDSAIGSRLIEMCKENIYEFKEHSKDAQNYRLKGII